jgi:hypothetical protein
LHLLKSIIQSKTRPSLKPNKHSKPTSSSGMYLTRPLHTLRSLSSPKSIFSTYNRSASGCLLHSTILPTRISHFDMSTTSCLTSTGCAATAGLSSKRRKITLNGRVDVCMHEYCYFWLFAFSIRPVWLLWHRILLGFGCSHSFA